MRKRREPPSLTIYLADLISVEEVETEFAPLREMQVLALSTVGRIYYITIGDDVQRSRWKDSLDAQSSQIRAMNAYYSSVKGVEPVAPPPQPALLELEPELESGGALPTRRPSHPDACG